MFDYLSLFSRFFFSLSLHHRCSYFSILILLEFLMSSFVRIYSLDHRLLRFFLSICFAAQQNQIIATSKLAESYSSISHGRFYSLSHLLTDASCLLFICVCVCVCLLHIDRSSFSSFFLLSLLSRVFLLSLSQCP